MIRYGISNIRELFGHKINLEMVYRNPICRLEKWRGDVFIAWEIINFCFPFQAPPLLFYLKFVWLEKLLIVIIIKIESSKIFDFRKIWQKKIVFYF